ncbi:MAG TPA: M18 family aminopeptidase [Propionibacteriaceae bacterium]|nr:M18 family aminopeptidase [Propionibacteriaceae bacterium]
MAPMASHIDDLAAFVAASPTSYHAVAEIASRLDASRFTAVQETDEWEPQRLGYVVRDGAVIAWRVPEGWGPRDGVRVVGSHTDSPALKLKPNPLLSSVGWKQLGVEVYGGPLLGTWLDRELGLAGRLVTRDGDVRLVATGPILRVPHLATHLDRTLADHVQLDRQRHLQPVYALGAAPDPYELLLSAAGLPGAELAALDVFCYPTQPSAVFGAQGEFFASWRLDNLSSVHASLVAFLDEAAAGESLAVFAAFDHEEVGSSTRSGASGPFLADVLRRLTAGLGLDEAAHLQALAASACVSADAGHAVHPNYPEHHDPTNRPLPNGGPLLKLNAQQRYASDATGSALWYAACRAAGVPTQEFVSNNAVPCGSTIGPLTATRLGIVTVDVGIPLLSMHSARELCGVDDPGHLAKALVAYWAGA